MIPRHYKNQRGNIAFYAIILLPTVLTLSVVLVDFAGWHYQRNLMQRDADRIALQLAQHLPDTQRIQNVLLAQLQDPELPYDIRITQLSASSVEVELETRYEAAFDFFVGEQSFTAIESSRAGVVPTDFGLVIADGNSLWPGFTYDAAMQATGINAAWSGLGHNSPSNYFNMVQAPSTQNCTSGWCWQGEWNQTSFRTALTQNCYNPVFSALKLAALSVVDAVGGMDRNRISVVYTPGEKSGEGYQMLRGIRGEVTINGQTLYPNKRGGFHDPSVARSQAEWSPYEEPNVGPWIGDEFCWLLAHPSVETTLQLPTTFSHLGLARANNSTCLQEFYFPIPSSQHWPYNRIRQEYVDQCLTLREAIFYHAARVPNFTGFTATPDIITSVNQVIAEMAAVGTGPVLSYEQGVRENLALINRRVIVVITDFLPDPTSPAAQSLFDAISNAGAELSVITYMHPHAPANLAQQHAAWSAAASARGVNPKGNAIINMYFAQSPEDLLGSVSSFLVTAGREVALQS